MEQLYNENGWKLLFCQMCNDRKYTYIQEFKDCQYHLIFDNDICIDYHKCNPEKFEVNHVQHVQPHLIWEIAVVKMLAIK